MARCLGVALALSIAGLCTGFSVGNHPLRAGHSRSPTYCNPMIKSCRSERCSCELALLAQPHWEKHAAKAADVVIRCLAVGRSSRSPGLCLVHASGAMFDRIQTKLTDGLEPIKISVVNNSHKHSGELPGFCEEAARKASGLFQWRCHYLFRLPVASAWQLS